MGLLSGQPLFLVLSDDLVLLLDEPLNIRVEVVAGILKRFYLLNHLGFLLLCHQSLPHSIGNGAFVKSLVSLNGHFYFISDSDQQEAALSAVDGDLSDKLIEALGVQFFSLGADSCFSSRVGLQSLVKQVLKVDNFHSCGRSWRNVTNP